jgi:hypothetical protein
MGRLLSLTRTRANGEAAPQAAVYLFRVRSPHHMPVIRDSEHLMDRKTLFEAKRPQFTDYEAHELWQKYGEIVSVDGRPAALDSFLVTFLSENDMTAGPLALNSVVARALCKLLIDNGYGPV